MPRQMLNQTSSKISEQYSILVRERLADILDEPEQIQMTEFRGVLGGC